MGDRSLEDIVKEALANGKGIHWIAQECWTNDYARLVPVWMQHDIKVAMAEAKVREAQAELDRLKAAG